MRQPVAYFTIVLSLLASVDGNPALALNTSTHALVNEEAARQPRPGQRGLDQILKEELGFLGGIDQVLRERPVVRWIGEGGIREDDTGGGLAFFLGRSRFFRHFHDPLYQADGSGRGPWSEAGLRLLGQHESSIHWMQRTDQDVQAARTGNFSWQDARRYFRDALTVESADAREHTFADTFRALGQVMHLVVDASVPEHVRNDIHPQESICRELGFACYGNYEYWVSDQESKLGLNMFISTYLSNPLYPFVFDATILQHPANDSRAPVPVARLIDTDTYQGTDPNVTLGSAIGIAEFANANFFSEDTGYGQYPFPNVNTLVRIELPIDLPFQPTPRIRSYYKKAPGDGLDEVSPVLAECVLDELAGAEGVVGSRIGTCTDENVWAKTAEHMLPRAVSYAGGVLDYFFRGTMNLTVGEGATPPDRIVTITNTSLEAMDGIFSLYADDFSDRRSEVARGVFEGILGAGESSPEITFTPPSEVKVYVLIFEGRLGNPGSAAEEGALAAKFKNVPAVSSIEPVAGIVGDDATIVGQGFDPSAAASNIINFAGLAIPADTVDAAGTRLTFVVPDIPRSGLITITGLTPSVPSVDGGTVTIQGENFAGVPAPLTVTVGGVASNAIDFSPGGATRVIVEVLTRFDSSFFLNLGRGATFPFPATIVSDSMATVTIPPLLSLAPPPNPGSSNFRVGFTRLHLKFFDGSLSNFVDLFHAFPQITVSDAGLFLPELPFIEPPPEPIQIGQMLSRAITQPREIHSFEFQGEAGQIITIRVDGRDGFDPEIVFFAGSLGVLFDDDSGPGLNALLSGVTLPESGIFRIEIRSSFDTGMRTTGPYEISLQAVVPE